MLKPLGDRVVVQLKEEKEQTVGGFVLAGASQEKTKKAQVAVGEGLRTLTGELVASSLAQGDTILIENHVGTPVKDDGKDYLIIREADVLAVVND